VGVIYLKKIISFFIISITTFFMSINIFSQNISITVNGISGVSSDVQPFIKEGRTLVPVRFISESLGAKVEWIASLGLIRIKKNNLTITLKENTKMAIINNLGISDTMKILDIPVHLYNGRAYVPVRFIAETLGATVEWDNNSRAITINMYGIYDASGSVVGKHN
jgi:hypothetical protein